MGIIATVLLGASSGLKADYNNNHWQPNAVGGSSYETNGSGKMYL